MELKRCVCVCWREKVSSVNTCNRSTVWAPVLVSRSWTASRTNCGVGSEALKTHHLVAQMTLPRFSGGRLLRKAPWRTCEYFLPKKKLKEYYKNILCTSIVIGCVIIYERSIHDEYERSYPEQGQPVHMRVGINIGELRKEGIISPCL